MAAEPERGERVGEQQHERQHEERHAQIDGLRPGERSDPGVERRKVERRETVARQKRIHREARIDRAVEARRMLAVRALRIGARHRAGSRGRRDVDAIAVEGQSGSHGLVLRIAGLRIRIARRAGQRDDPAQHVDEEARQGQVRPGGIGGDVEEHDHPVAALVGGHDRRSVGQRGPGPRLQVAVGLGEDLAADADLVRHGEAEEGALAGERREGLRGVPGEGAAEAAPAAAQAHGHELVVAGGEPGARKAQQHAALFHEGGRRGRGSRGRGRPHRPAREPRPARR